MHDLLSMKFLVFILSKVYSLRLILADSSLSQKLCLNAWFEAAADFFLEDLAIDVYLSIKGEHYTVLL